MTDKKKIADWERIEFDYRAGIMSLREIAAAHGITEGAIRKRAKRDGWERDLGAKIQAKAESLVRKEAVRSEVRSSCAYQTTEKEIVEANASMQANALLDHRKDIKRSRNLAMKMLEELEQTTDNRELFAQLGLMLAAPDEKGNDKLNELYMKVIAMPQRVDSMKKLAETLKVLVGLEREAFGIDSGKDAATDAVEALRKLANGE